MWKKSCVSIHELYLNPSWWKRNSIRNIVFGLVVFSFSFISHWGACKNLWLESFSLRREQHIILIPLIEPFDRLDVRAQLKRQLVLGMTHHSHARKTTVSSSLKCSSACWSDPISHIVWETRTDCSHGAKQHVSMSCEGLFRRGLLS